MLLATANVTCYLKKINLTWMLYDCNADGKNHNQDPADFRLYLCNVPRLHARFSWTLQVYLELRALVETHILFTLTTQNWNLIKPGNTYVRRSLRVLLFLAKQPLSICADLPFRAELNGFPLHLWIIFASHSTTLRHRAWVRLYTNTIFTCLTLYFIDFTIDGAWHCSMQRVWYSPRFFISILGLLQTLS